MRPARSPRAALLSLLWRRARLRWRGLRLCFKARRGHRRRRTPSHRHLLVGDDGTGAGGHDQRARISARVTCSWRSMPANRTVSRARWRSSRRPEPRIRQADSSARDSSSSQRRWRRASATRTRSRCPSWRDGIDATTAGEWKKASDAIRAGAGDPARPVRRGHLGIEHRAESRDLGAHVSGRAR